MTVVSLLWKHVTLLHHKKLFASHLLPSKGNINQQVVSLPINTSPISHSELALKKFHLPVRKSINTCTWLYVSNRYKSVLGLLINRRRHCKSPSKIYIYFIYENWHEDSLYYLLKKKQKKTEQFSHNFHDIISFYFNTYTHN